MRTRHVHAAAEECLVGEQIRDARQRGEIGEECGARQKIAQLPHGRRKARLVGDLNFFPLVDGVEGEAERLGRFERRIFGGDVARGGERSM